MGILIERITSYINLHGEYDPGVSAVEIQRLFGYIPEGGPWQLPEPYQPFSDRKSFRTFWDKQLAKWVVFLNEAEKGLGSVEAAGDVTPESVQALRRFTWVNLGSDHGKAILSVKRGLVALLSPEAQQATWLSAEDMLLHTADKKITRKFVNGYAIEDSRHFLEPELPVNPK